MAEAQNVFLFPPDLLPDLPVWRFLLQVKVPSSADQRTAQSVGAQLKIIQCRAVTFPTGLDNLQVDPRTNTIPVQIEVPEAVRKRPNSQEDLESDLSRIVLHLGRCGFPSAGVEAADQPVGPKPAPTLADALRFSEREAKLLSLVFSLALLIPPIAIFFGLMADFQARLVRGFGPKLLGLPPNFVIGFGLILLTAPLPYFIMHWTRIMCEAFNEGCRMKPGAIFVYWLTTAKKRPDLQFCRRMCLYGLIYAVFAFVAWGWFMSSFGI